MFEHNTLHQRQKSFRLYFNCVLPIILILRIVTFYHHNSQFNHMCNILHTCCNKLHMLKKAPRRRPTVKAKTCWSINQQRKGLCNQFVLNFTYVCNVKVSAASINQAQAFICFYVGAKWCRPCTSWVTRERLISVLLKVASHLTWLYHHSPKGRASVLGNNTTSK
jgi:hypothetical protein